MRSNSDIYILQRVAALEVFSSVFVLRGSPVGHVFAFFGLLYVCFQLRFTFVFGFWKNESRRF